MVGVELRFVDAQRGRDGRVRYWYFRRNGRRWRLPGEPGEVGNLHGGVRPSAGGHQPGAAVRGAVAAGLVWGAGGRLLRSPEFKDRKPSTQSMYRRVLEPIAKRIGRHPAGHVERRHVKAMRDEKADTPGMANMVVSVLRLVLSYAVDNDYIAANPALKVTTFKLGEHRAWTHDELAAFERRWAPGTMQRRAYMLARYTGQRRGDLAAMTKAHRKDGEIRVVQEKTGAELWIPEHRDLAAELARGEQGHMSLLTRRDGSAFDPKALGLWFADAIDKAELPDDCVLHGLRKTAAKALAEAGCTVHEIASITGHKSACRGAALHEGGQPADGRDGCDSQAGSEQGQNGNCQTCPAGLPNRGGERLK